MRTDPVCGMEVMNHTFTHVHEHKVYYFCSRLCQQHFMEHPAIYLDMENSRIQELELIRIETIECLSRAAEFKDNETGEHILRMAKHCQHLAKLAGWSVKKIQRIELASPMHDIGKIGIPEHVLLKKGRLNPEERQIMQQHPDIGARIIGENPQSDLMKMAATIALSHHEKWDGTGYPKMLHGEMIPIEGRIVGICDVFDALISKRPYKQPWAPEKVRRHFENQRGKHFDPALTELLLDNFQSFIDC